MTVDTQSTLAPRRRVARGPARPQYLSLDENDRMMMIVTALAGELSSLRDRLDTHEALAEQGLAATADAIEAFQLTPERAQARDTERKAYLHRIYRIVMEDLHEVREARRQPPVKGGLPTNEA